MCLRVASDFRRRGHRRHERLYADPPVVGRGANQEDRTSQRQTLLRMDAALARLNPEQREVFVLYEIEELPMIEVARAIARPLQTAYSRLHAARKAVIAAMAPHLQEE
jgi:RNA polymerase sigma-70 factor (ECF subfamily)